MYKTIALTLCFLLAGMVYGCSEGEPGRYPMQESHKIEQDIDEDKIFDSENNYNTKVLKTIYEDLDNDGEKEKIEVIEFRYPGENGYERLEGRLRVTNSKEVKETKYAAKGNSISGIFQDIRIEDLDKDGIRDLFVVFPEMSNWYPLNYFSIYNYAKNTVLNFDYEYCMNTLSEFLHGFKYKYKSLNELDLVNETVNYKGIIKVGNYLGEPVPNDGVFYDNSASALPIAIINEDYIKDKQGERFITNIDLEKYYEGMKIRVPLLLSALHHEDIIAEIDVYFTVDTNFNLVKDTFKIYSVNQVGGYKKELSSEGTF